MAAEPNAHPPDDKAVPAPRRRGWWWVEVALFAMAIAAFAAVSHYASSGALMSMIAAQAVEHSGGRLAIDAPEGSPFGEMRAGRIVWSDVDLTVTVKDARLSLDWLGLLRWALVVRELAIGEVEVLTPPSDVPAVLPDSLKLPVALDIRQARLDRLVFRTAAISPRGESPGASSGASADEPTVLTDLAVSLHYDRRTYTIDKLGLHSDLGTLSAGGTVGDTRPYPVAARALLETAVTDQPLAVNATLGGDLQALTVDAGTVMREAALSAQASLSPFARKWLGKATLRIDRLDLARFSEGLPATSLNGTLDVGTLDIADDFSGTLHLVNDAVGPLDRQQLPIASIDTRVVLKGDRLSLNALRLDGPPGLLAGDAAVTLSSNPSSAQSSTLPDFTLRLATESLDLSRAVSTLRKTALRGTVTLKPVGKGLAFDVALADREISLTTQARLEGDVLTIAQAKLQARDGIAEFGGTAGIVEPYRFDLKGTLARFDPARFADLPKGLINGRFAASGVAKPKVSALVSLTLADSRFNGLALAGTVSTRYEPDRLREVNAALQLGANRLSARGNLGAPADRLDLSLDARQLAELDKRFGGRLSIEGQLRDQLASPGMSLTLTGSELKFEDTAQARSAVARVELARLDVLLAMLGRIGVAGLPAGPATLSAGDLRIDLKTEGLVVAGETFEQMKVELAGDAMNHALSVQAVSSARHLDARARIEGGFGNSNGNASGSDQAWRGRLTELNQKRAPTVALTAPAALELGRTLASISGLVLAVDGASGATLRIEEARWADRRVQLRGGATGLPIRWLSAIGAERYLKLDGDKALRLGATFDLSGTPGKVDSVRGQLAVFRESGDLLIATDGPDGAVASIPPVASTVGLPAGLQQFDLKVDAGGDRLSATVDIRGTAIGSIRGEASAPLQWPAGSALPDLAVPLTGMVNLDLPSLAITRGMVGDAWRIDGALKSALTLAGTLRTPRISGRIEGSRLLAIQRELGMRLTDGELAATLQDNIVTIQKLKFASGKGSVSMSGTLRADDRSEAVVVLDQMPIPLGAGQRLLLSGEATATLRTGQLNLRGSLRADEGVIEISSPSGADLANDVIVVRQSAQAASPAAAAAAARAAAAAGDPADTRGFRIVSNLQIDLGDRFKVWGSGVDARLTGQLSLRGRLPDAPRLTGTVRVAKGTYTAFGQRLEIERGTLVFSGPVDNPAIDIEAYRRYLPVEAGVAITGTARRPDLKLVSRPDVPYQDKLSWLVLGTGSDNVRGAGAGSSALQTAAAVLLASGDPNATSPSLARTFGLDVLSVRTGQGGSSSSAGSAASSAQDSIVTLGKRLTDRLFLSYEQSLRGLQNLVRLQYELTERFSVRASGGTTNAVDMIWSYRYD
jgi:translocation and assembly module TamB